MISDDLKPLEWERYKQVRSFAMALRTNHLPVTVDSVSSLWKCAHRKGMRRADMCRYLASENREDRSRQKFNDRFPFDESSWIRLESGTVRELFGKFPELEFTRESKFPGTDAEPVTLQTSNTKDKVKNISLVPSTGEVIVDQSSITSSESEKTPNPKAPSPAPGSKPLAQDMPEVVFEDQADERRVSALLALENPSGKMGASKRLALRVAMRNTLDEFGLSAWRSGVDVAIGKATSWAYAKTVIKNNPNPSQAKAAEVLSSDIFRGWIKGQPYEGRKVAGFMSQWPPHWNLADARSWINDGVVPSHLSSVSA